MSSDVAVEGFCEDRFAGLRECFAGHFTSGDELGAALAVTVGGECVVDLWGGFADAERSRPWRRDTLVNLYSTTKGMTALCALRLLEQGELDAEAPVSEYWPEFAAAGKKGVTVRMLFNHRAGLAAVSDPLEPDAIYDWEAMTAALAAQAPWWEPGIKHGYHALTFGWLLGELVRRVSGLSLGAYFREYFADPLDLDLHIGLAGSEHSRCASIVPPPPAPAPGEPSMLQIIMTEPGSVTARAFTNPPSLMMPGTVNCRRWREAEIPAANGHGTARALARIYGALACGGCVDGIRVLSPAVIEAARTEESYGLDETLRVRTRFGLGFMLSQPGASFGPSDSAFGHPGAGGSLAFADPENSLGFAYVMNRMGPHILIDPRPSALIEALYRAI